MRPCHPRGRAVPNPLWTLCPRWWPRASSGRPHQQLRTVKEKGQTKSTEEEHAEKPRTPVRGETCERCTQLTNWRKDAKYFQGILDRIIRDPEFRNRMIENHRDEELCRQWDTLADDNLMVASIVPRFNDCNKRQKETTCATCSLRNQQRALSPSFTWRNWQGSWLTPSSGSHVGDAPNTMLRLERFFWARLRWLQFTLLLHHGSLPPDNVVNQRYSSETFYVLPSLVWRKVEERHGRRRKDNISVLCWF